MANIVNVTMSYNVTVSNISTSPNNTATTNPTIGDTERILLGLWSLVTLLLGGVGNILILLAIHISRFKIDTTSKWFISNMAVSDVLYVLFIVVPSVITNFSNSWVFGDGFCGFTASLSSMLCIIHLLSLTLLAINKLLRCCFPLRSIYMELNVWVGSLVTFLMWTLSLGPIVVNYVLHRPFTFDPNLNRCTIHDDNADIFWVKFNKLCFIFYIGLPLLLSVAANTGLFIIVVRKATTVNKAKISMIMSLSLLAIVSWVPGVIYGTVFNSSGYPIFLRFVNYVISVDTTFSTLLFIYFYPSFGSFFIGVFTCGMKGTLSRIESERKRSRAMMYSNGTYAPLQSRVSSSLLSQTVSSASINIPGRTRSISLDNQQAPRSPRSPRSPWSKPKNAELSRARSVVPLTTRMGSRQLLSTMATVAEDRKF